VYITSLLQSTKSGQIQTPLLGGENTQAGVSAVYAWAGRLTQPSDQALSDLGTSATLALEQKGLPVPWSTTPELFLGKLSADCYCKSLGEDVMAS